MSFGVAGDADAGVEAVSLAKGALLVIASGEVVSMTKVVDEFNKVGSVLVSFWMGGVVVFASGRVASESEDILNAEVFGVHEDIFELLCGKV